MSTKAQLQEIYIGLLGRAADPAGLQYWADEVDNGVLSLAQVRENIVNDQPEYEEMYEGKSREEVVNQLYINLFGRPAEDAGLEYWVEGEGAEVSIDDLVFALSDGAGTSDRQTLDNRVEVAQYYTDNAATFDKEESAALIADVDADPASVEDAKNAIGSGEQPSVPGETYVLTEGRDVVTGTANDDLFIGLVGQNQNGAISNALSTGDMLDGGAGRDRIEATMLNDNETDATNLLGGQAPRPITSNIEEVSIEALEAVRLDATRMEGVEEFWSDFSRGHLQIDNVNLRGSNVNNTNDITFGLKDAQGGPSGEAGVGLRAYFESQALVRPASTKVNSQLLIRIADVSTETPETPLANVSVNLGFSLNGVEYELEDVRSTDGTYAGLVGAIKNALVAEGLPAVNVELSTPYEEVTFAGNTVTLPFIAQEILLTDPAGQAFDSVNFTQSAIQPVQGGFLVAGNAAPVDPSVVSSLIETNLVLDNAGRGSVAGHVEIGGASNSSRGIEKFNVTVERDSAIASLATTNGLLQEIEIDSAADADGSLYIGATQAGLREIDANGFVGTNLQLGGVKGGYNGNVINNLAFLDAGQTTANVTFIGGNTNGTVASIQTGSGNDNIVLHQEGVSASGSTVTQVVINAGAGNNTVTLSTADDGNTNTAVVTTGAGNDVVTGGSNQLTVNTGAGDDVIYADNSGLAANGFGATGTLDAGDAFTGNETQTINGVDVQTANLLYGRDVRVTLTVSDQEADSFATGFEATVSIEPTAGRYLTTEGDLYRAIAKAINEDAVLSKLAVASIDSNGHLTVTYLIDGVSAAEESVQFEIVGDWDDLSGTQQKGIVDELKSAYSNSNIADVEAAYNAAGVDGAIETAAGTNSVADGGNNIVNAGAGNDVIVLSSDDDIVDTVLMSGGSFGHNTIVHFDDTNDLLGFSEWLDNQVSGSGSTDSQVRADSTVVDVDEIVENSVAVVDFTALALGTGVTFANMTANQVLGALNGAVGGLGSVDADLVGNTVKAILLVQNEDNLGEYKVFEVAGTTATGATNDFTGVSLVGTLDFGESVNLADINIV